MTLILIKAQTAPSAQASTCRNPEVLGGSGKRLGLLHDLMPTISRVAVLVNPRTQIAGQLIEDAQSAGKALGFSLYILTASNTDEID